MKKLIFLTITLALLGGGYYYYNQNSDQVSTTSYEYLNIEKGDIKKTHSNISALKKFTGYKPLVDIDEGVKEFIIWFKKYYKFK